MLDLSDHPWRGVVATLGVEGVAIRRVATVPAEGFDRGMIVDMEAAREGLVRLLEGLSISPRSGTHSRAVVLISGEIDYEVVEGSVEVPRGEVTRRHVEEAHRQAQLTPPRRRSRGMNTPMEKVQFYPMHYILNGNENHRVLSPVGMQAAHLTVRGYLLFAARTFVDNLRQLLKKVGLPYHEFHLRAFGVSHWITSHAERDAGVLVLQTGESMLDGVLWYRNYPMRFFTLGVGWKDYVQEIAKVFHVPLPAAREMLNTFPAIVEMGHMGMPNRVEASAGDQVYRVPRKKLIQLLYGITEDIFREIRERFLREPERDQDAGHDWLDLIHAVAINGPFFMLEGLDSLIAEAWGKQLMDLEPSEEALEGIRDVPPGEGGDILRLPEFFPLLGIVRWKSRERRRVRSPMPMTTNGAGWVSQLRSWWKEFMEKLKLA